MWNATLGWNGLNKSESFVTVILKVNPIQIGVPLTLKISGLGGGVQKNLCWCYRNETWKKGLETFEKY